MNNLFFSIRLLSSLSLLFLLLASPVLAQVAAPTTQASEQISAQVKQSLERLQLTEEQHDAVATIMEESFMKRLAVMEKYGISPENPEAIQELRMRTKRKVGKDMDKVHNETEKQLGEVLTEEQMKEWKEIEEERRAQMRKQFK